MFTFIYSICFLHLWFQLVQSIHYLFKELVEKVVRVGVWDYKNRSCHSMDILCIITCISYITLVWVMHSFWYLRRIQSYSCLKQDTSYLLILYLCIDGIELESSADSFVVISNKCDTAFTHADIFLSNYSRGCCTQPAWWSRVYMPNSVSCGAYFASYSLWLLLTSCCLPIFQMNS